MQRNLILVAKGIAIFILSMVLLAVLTHLFPPSGADGFANPAVVIIPFFVSLVSAFVYMAGSMIWKSKESILFKSVVVVNVVTDILAVFS